MITEYIVGTIPGNWLTKILKKGTGVMKNGGAKLTVFVVMIASLYVVPIAAQTDLLPGWSDITDRRVSEIQQQAVSLDRTVVPRVVSYGVGAKQVLFVVHGTFVEAGDYIQGGLFKKILKFAEDFFKRKPVEIVFFQWSGGNSTPEREKGAINLRDLIHTSYMDKSRYSSINALAHSHGGNVVNGSTVGLNRSFENIINIFTPVRSDFLPRSFKFKNYYSFWSSGDQIQYIGSIAFYPYTPEDIKDALTGRKLPDLNYWLHWTTKGGRKFKIPERRVVNIRVQYDGKAVEHIDKGPLFPYISPIIKTVDDLYELNDDFDVNIDTRSGDVYIAIRNQLRACDIPGIESETKEAQEATVRQLGNEKNVSSSDELSFKRKYGWSIHSKGSRVVDYAIEFKNLASFACGWK